MYIEYESLNYQCQYAHGDDIIRRALLHFLRGIIRLLSSRYRVIFRTRKLLQRSRRTCYRGNVLRGGLEVPLLVRRAVVAANRDAAERGGEV